MTVVYLNAVVEAPKRVGQCPSCGRPFLRLQGGCVLIESRHGRETHINALSPAELRNLADILEAKVDEEYHTMI